MSPLIPHPPLPAAPGKRPYGPRHISGWRSGWATCSAPSVPCWSCQPWASLLSRQNWTRGIRTLITSRMEGRTASSLVKDEFVPNVMGASHGVRFSLRLWVLGAN